MAGLSWLLFTCCVASCVRFITTAATKSGYDCKVKPDGTRLFSDEDDRRPECPSSRSSCSRVGTINAQSACRFCCFDYQTTATSIGTSKSPTKTVCGQVDGEILFYHEETEGLISCPETEAGCLASGGEQSKSTCKLCCAKEWERTTKPYTVTNATILAKNAKDSNDFKEPGFLILWIVLGIGVLVAIWKTVRYLICWWKRKSGKKPIEDTEEVSSSTQSPDRVTTV